SFRYKGKQTDVATIGRDLNVRAVLTVRITQHGDALTISTELLDTRDLRNLWGQQYSRNMAGLLTVQQDISREIAQALRIRLGGEDMARVTNMHTKNAEAYQLYLKGQYQLGKESEEGFRLAEQAFRQAVETDPSYALAYTGLANIYGLYFDFHILSF